MNRLKILLTDKRFLTSLVISTCLALICKGGAVSKLAPPFSFQPHHPRAVLETTNKLSESTANHRIIAVELCSDVREIPRRATVNPRFARATFQFELTTSISKISARSPPALAS